MKNINTTFGIDPTKKQPLTARSLRFLQEGKDDDVAAIIQAIVLSNLSTYSLAVPYVISGCVVSNVNKSVTAGEVFFGGKYYQTSALTGVTNVAQFVLAQTQDVTADPLTFSDSSVQNVHDIFKFTATDTATPGAFSAAGLVSLYGGGGKITFENRSVAQSTASLTFVDLTGSTYTTPAGIAKTWLISHKSICKWAALAGIPQGGAIEIYNGTTLASLDVSYAFLELAGAVNNTLLTASCHRVISLAGGTIVKVRVKSSGGASVEFSDNNFSMIEI